MRQTNYLALALLMMFPSVLAAEVADSGPAGFTIRGTLNLQAPPADAYQKFVLNVGSWWAPGHTFSRDAGTLSIDDRPGTKLTYTYSVGGYIPNGADAWAKPVDGMLAETFGRFQNYADKGNPALKEGK